MKKAIMSIFMVGAVTVMTGCCWDGGCAGYVRPVAVCNGCGTCGTSCVKYTTCGTCGYGYGYNDWY